MFKFKEILINLRSSFWFVPSLFVTFSIALAFLLIEIDIRFSKDLAEDWPRLLGAGAEASRGMLSTIANSTTSMMTVAFSMTLVTLALASSQYTSRILRNFMRSQITQIVLGVFAGVFTYCLIVLRSIRGGDEFTFIPSLAIVMGFILAVIGVVALVFFIHHIASSIQASSILALIHQETIATIDKLFPEMMGEEAHQPSATQIPNNLKQAILSPHSGHLQSLGEEEMVELAKKINSVIKMNYAVGDFVIFGTPLVYISDHIEMTEELTQEFRDLFIIRPFRTIEQDALFGIRQTVDIALKALSPGINDTTTAVNCVEYLTANLSHITQKKIPSIFRYEHNELRVIARAPNYEDFLEESFAQIRTCAKGNITVMRSLVRSIQVLSEMTSSPLRRHYLALQAQKISEVSNTSFEFPYDQKEMKNELGGVREIFRYL